MAEPGAGGEQQAEALEAPAPVRERPGRERKAPETFKVEVTEKAEFVIEKGKGERIGDMPAVCKMLEKHQARDQVLQNVYVAAFGRRGAALNVKKHIRDFSGYAFPADAREAELEKRSASLTKKGLVELKAMAEVVCIERSGTKAELTQRLIDFFDKPSGSGKPVPAPAGKRKRAATPATKKAKAKTAKGKPAAKAGKASPAKKKAKASPAKGKPAVDHAAGIKKPPAAVELYVKARLPSLKEKNPEVSDKDLSSHLRDKWKGLAADKKAKYEEEHQDLVQQYETEVAAAKAKAAKPTIVDEDDSDDDEGVVGDEEEAEEEEEAEAEEEEEEEEEE